MSCFRMDSCQILIHFSGVFATPSFIPSTYPIIDVIGVLNRERCLK